MKKSFNKECYCGHIESEHFEAPNKSFGQTHSCKGDEGMCECCEFGWDRKVTRVCSTTGNTRIYALNEQGVYENQISLF